MWELVKAGGWLMLPLVLCSIFTVAITIERFIRLKKSMILPKVLLLNQTQNADVVMQQLQQDKALEADRKRIVETAQDMSDISGIVLTDDIKNFLLEQN